MILDQDGLTGLVPKIVGDRNAERARLGRHALKRAALEGIAVELDTGRQARHGLHMEVVIVIHPFADGQGARGEDGTSSVFAILPRLHQGKVDVIEVAVGTVVDIPFLNERMRISARVLRRDRHIEDAGLGGSAADRPPRGVVLESGRQTRHGNGFHGRPAVNREGPLLIKGNGGRDIHSQAAADLQPVSIANDIRLQSVGKRGQNECGQHADNSESWLDFHFFFVPSFQ